MWNRDELHLHMEVGLSRKEGICSLIPQRLFADYLLASRYSTKATEEPVLCLTWLLCHKLCLVLLAHLNMHFILEQKAPSPAFFATETRLGLTYLPASSVD